MSRPPDHVQGTLDLLVLKILALEPLHGWAISQRLKQVSGEVLQVSDGSLYPALHKLEQEGWIAAEWRPSENNRRAKFYSLTRVGRRQLQKEAASWSGSPGRSPSSWRFPRYEVGLIAGSTCSRFDFDRCFDRAPSIASSTRNCSTTSRVRSS